MSCGRSTARPSGASRGETDQAPGRGNACPPQRPALASRFAVAPVVAGDWSSATVESGDSATVELDLPPGDWDLSLQYDSTRPVTLSAPAFRSTLPGNLDYRGTAPYWPAGEIQGGAPVTVTATVADPPPAGRMLGAHSVAHLGALAATGTDPPGGDCRGYVDWYVR